MACGTAFDAFRVMQEYLSEQICARALFDSALLNAVPSGVYPKGVGTSVSMFTIEPQELGTENTGGTAITKSGSGTTAAISNACAYSMTDIQAGYTEETYSPVQWQYRGPLYCKDSKYFEFNADVFFNQYVDMMTGAVKQDMESWVFYNYSRLVPIYTARANGFDSIGTSSSTLTAPAATSELTQDMLDRLVYLLMANRSVPTSTDGSGLITYGPQGPQWSLLIHPGMSQRIIRANGDFRNDIRYADPNMLLARLGAYQSVKNYAHVPWLVPQRFTHDGTKYVQVPRFVSSAATKGVKSTVNPNWLNPNVAMYEAALILSPYVMRKEWIVPSNQIGNESWNGERYMGEWNWIVGPSALAATDGDACYDPLNKYGRHIGDVKIAAGLGCNRQSGAIIFYRRCPTSATIVSCT